MWTTTWSHLTKDFERLGLIETVVMSPDRDSEDRSDQNGIYRTQYNRSNGLEVRFSLWVNHARGPAFEPRLDPLFGPWRSIAHNSNLGVRGVPCRNKASIYSER